MEQEHSTIDDGTEPPVERSSESQDQHSSSEWVRPREGRILAGVAVGIAARTDLPLWLVRALFVITTFINGFGVIAYLLGWALMPERAGGPTFVDDARNRLGEIDRPSKVVGLVLIGLGALIALGNTGLLGSPLMVSLALGALGVVLIRQS